MRSSFNFHLNKYQFIPRPSNCNYFKYAVLFFDNIPSISVPQNYLNSSLIYLLTSYLLKHGSLRNATPKENTGQVSAYYNLKLPEDTYQLCVTDLIPSRRQILGLLPQENLLSALVLGFKSTFHTGKFAKFLHSRAQHFLHSDIFRFHIFMLTMVTLEMEL